MPNNFLNAMNMPWQPQANAQAVQSAFNQQFASQQQQQVPTQQLTFISGIDSAKAYPMMPNSTVPLFDNDGDVLYVKSSDNQGFSKVRAFKLTEFDPNAQPQHTVMPSGQYVTQQEFERFKQEVMDAQHSSTQQPNGEYRDAEQHQAGS